MLVSTGNVNTYFQQIHVLLLPKSQNGDGIFGHIIFVLNISICVSIGCLLIFNGRLLRDANQMKRFTYKISAKVHPRITKTIPPG